MEYISQKELRLGLYTFCRNRNNYRIPTWVTLYKYKLVIGKVCKEITSEICKRNSLKGNGTLIKIREKVNFVLTLPKLLTSIRCHHYCVLFQLGMRGPRDLVTFHKLIQITRASYQQYNSTVQYNSCSYFHQT